MGVEVRGLNPWLPPCEVCADASHMELRAVEDRGRRVRNASSVAVDSKIGGHDPPRFSEHTLRLLQSPVAARLLPDGAER